LRPSMWGVDFCKVVLAAGAHARNGARNQFASATLLHAGATSDIPRQQLFAEKRRGGLDSAGKRSKYTRHAPPGGKLDIYLYL
jgi:hypothetical protein